MFIPIYFCISNSLALSTPFLLDWQTLVKNWHLSPLTGRPAANGSSTLLSSASSSQPQRLQRAATSCSHLARVLAPWYRAKANTRRILIPNACPRVWVWRARWTPSVVRSLPLQLCANTSGTSAFDRSRSRWTSCMRCSERWRRWITNGSWSTISTPGCASGTLLRSATSSWCCSYIKWVVTSSVSTKNV